MKILVTGCTGFIGQQVVSRLLQMEHKDIVTTSRDPEKARQQDWYAKTDYRPADLDNFTNDWYTYFGRPDKLIHLAWKGLPHFMSTHHLTENLPADIRFLDAMIAGGLSDLTVTGTCLEYGLQEGKQSESAPCNPVTTYGIAKDALRRYLEQSTQKPHLHFRWLRLFYPYGPGQSEKSLIPQLEKAIAENRSSFDMSPGDQQRDFLPVEQMAENIVAAALQTREKGIINICSGQPQTVKAFAEAYLRKRGVQMELRTGVYPYPAYEPHHFWGDRTKLNRILQYE